jgi:2,3-bisphosphoglycerate-independent phosphoglycerate mutase
MNNKKTALIIMDGWGLGSVAKSDAIQHANVPFVSSLYNQYSHTTLITCGEAVGLPEGQMGNSEVGHLNLGAGRVVYQELQRINVAIRDGEFQKNQVLLDAIHHAKSSQKKLHLMGLVSDGGVHAHLNHLKAIVDVCEQEGLKDVLIHAFTDGRDTDPKSGLKFLTELQTHLNNHIGSIASVTGRYYAMDRDKRWERVQLAYNALVLGQGNPTDDVLLSIEKSYQAGETDEFIKPIINTNVSNGKIENGDVVFCFNFRTDRCREITEVLTQHPYPEFNMHPLDLYYVTMTSYDQSYKNVHVVFENDNLEKTLGEVLAANNKTQLRIAETEKYPHVSFFFNGGRELPFNGEKRIMIPSPKVATYDLKPEMSAFVVADAAILEIENEAPDFICLNFANADMVGHTGVWDAVVKAVETVDTCVEKVVAAALKKDYMIFLTADHGNADYIVNEDGSPNTAHTLNPVPLIVIDKSWKGEIKTGKLGDLAPTILHVMHIVVPEEMKGDILLQK